MPIAARPTPAAVLRFADSVVRGVRKSRKDRLTCGKITRLEHDRDIAEAEEMHRWIKQVFLNDSPLN